MRRERLVGNQPVSEHAGIQVQDATEAEIEAVVIGWARAVAQHQPETDRIHHARSGRKGQKRPPAPTLFVPTVEPHVQLRHEPHEVVSLLIDPDDTIDGRDRFDPSGTKIVRPSEAEAEPNIPEQPGALRRFRNARFLL